MPEPTALGSGASHPVSVIRSGGQTGVDRGALDAARACGVPITGWCPRGGWAEDFPEPPGLLIAYPELTATPSSDPAVRTRWNVRDSHATLILQSTEALSPGTALTRDIAVELERPAFLTDGTDVAAVRAWLATLGPQVILNVAGPRESEAPGSYLLARDFVHTLLA